MKILIAALAALLVQVAAVVAGDMRTAPVELPATTPVSWDVGDGRRCIATTFSPTFRMLELVVEYQTVATLVVMRDQPQRGDNVSELLKWCSKTPQ